MGTMYPRSDDYPPYPELFNKNSNLAVIVSTTHVGILLANFVFRKKSRHCFAHVRVMGWNETPYSGKYLAPKEKHFLVGLCLSMIEYSAAPSTGIAWLKRWIFQFTNVLVSNDAVSPLWTVWFISNGRQLAQMKSGSSVSHNSFWYFCANMSSTWNWMMDGGL